MPRILIVVDGLKPVLSAQSLEVEDDIGRLAQMARATGMHLVLATAHPTPDVLTGLIKANTPARLALHVAARSDSRAILDCHGAEELGNDSDMLFLPPSQHRLIRLPADLPSDTEIDRVAGRLRLRGLPTYDPAVTAPPPPEGDGLSG
jgi:S-DNA-T family DNA segregation ATPase FtsK/SpoIIIE